MSDAPPETDAMARLEPVAAEFLDDAPFRVTSSVTVDAAIGACWDLIADQASWPQWFDGMTSVDATPWIWTGPGDERTVTVSGMRVRERCIAFESQKEYAFTILQWPLPIAKRAAEGIRLAAPGGANGPTELTYIGAFESTFIGRRLESVMRRQLADAWEAAFVGLGLLAVRNSSSGRQ